MDNVIASSLLVPTGEAHRITPTRACQHPIHPSPVLSCHLRVPCRHHSRATPMTRRVLIPGDGYDR
jgi:hypothetical protein